MKQGQWILLAVGLANLCLFGIVTILGAANQRRGEHPFRDLWLRPQRVFALLTPRESWVAGALGSMMLVAAFMLCIAIVRS